MNTHHAGSTPNPGRFSIEDELEFLQEAHCGDTLKARRQACATALRQGAPAPLDSSELSTAGSIAWRNHARCIGRRFWKSLLVRDHRHVEAPDAIFESLCDHMTLAYNGGQVRSVMTVFAPAEASSGRAPRIWNHQLCGYAGYKSADGSVLGDPKNADFTGIALELGWIPPKERSPFDLLPWIISGYSGPPKLFPVAVDALPEVPIQHPEFDWFVELGIRWYAVPVISDMCFHVAGTNYTAAPFNGWYMGTEIGARNLADSDRYDFLPTIAKRMGLNMRREATLWKDRALLELNVAVLHSYELAGVRMTDHHTASRDFMRFCKNEAADNREVSAQWSWMVPPMAPSTTPQYCMPMKKRVRTPDFHFQERPHQAAAEKF